MDATSVDMTKAGVFYVNYTAEDASGNQTLGSLEVTMVAAETGCGSAINIAGSFVAVFAVLGAGVLFFVRKRK